MSARNRYYRYRPYKSNSSFARRQQRAADQQRDSTTVVINANESFDCGQTINQIYLDRGDDGWFDTGCAAINVYDVLRKSEYFSEFSKLYDQFKIDNIKAKIIATNWTVSKDDNSNEKITETIKARSYVIVTAWDRSGIEKSNIVESQDWIDHPNIPENRKFYVKVGKNITTYSSAKTKHLGPGSAYEIVRQLYPENLQEKGQFISTNLLKRQQTRVNTEYFPYNCFYKKVVPVTDVNPNGYEYVATDFDSKYPNNLIADPTIPFKPTLLVDVIAGPNPRVTDIKERDPEGFDTILTIGINKIKPVTFDVEFDIVVTFRGLRYNKNVDINRIYDTTVYPLYPLVPYPNLLGNYNIVSIEMSDSRFKNRSIISRTEDVGFRYGLIINKEAVLNENADRYVFYFETDNTIVNGHSNYGIWIINTSNKAFQWQFSQTQIYLFDYVDNSFDGEHGNNYINVLIKGFLNDPNNEVVYRCSKANDVPHLPYDDRVSLPVKFLDNIHNGYIFNWNLNNNEE